MNRYNGWQKKIINALKTRRVLILAGARLSGKTTPVKNLNSEHITQITPPNNYINNTVIYRTLDDATLLETAVSNPHGFVSHNDELMIIDEIQRAPILLKAIQQDVDENPAPGRFLLTGSANIQLLI